MKSAILIVSVLLVIACCVKGQSSCLQKLQEANSKPMPGRQVPECDTNGNYKKIQCYPSEGLCYCVDTVTGERNLSTATRGKPGPNCG